MQVTETALIRALHDVFADNGVWIGGRMLEDDLAEQWRALGLRREDLGHAIRVGIERGLFARQEVEGQSCIAILSDEVPAIDRRRGWFQRLFKGAGDLVSLARARGRQPPSATTDDADTPHRRARDQRPGRSARKPPDGE